MDRVHKRMFYIFSALLFCFTLSGLFIISVEAETLFRNGFEDGDDAWTSNYTDEATLEIESKDPYGGIYHAEANHTFDGWNTAARFQKDLTGKTEVYARGVWSFNSTPSDTYDWGLLSLKKGAAWPGSLSILGINATHVGFKLTGGGTEEYYNITKAEFTSGDMILELGIKVNTVDGWLAFWYNGDLKINSTIDYSGTSDIDQFYFRLVEGSDAPMSLMVRLDMAEIADTGPIGVPSSMPTHDYTWYNTTRAGDGIQITSDWEVQGSGQLVYGVLQHNNSGSSINETWMEMNPISDTLDYSFILNPTVGKVVELKWYVNSTSGVWVTVGPIYLTITATPTGPYHLSIEGYDLFNDSIPVEMLVGFNLRGMGHATNEFNGEEWREIGSDFGGNNVWNETTLGYYLDTEKLMGGNVFRQQLCYQWWEENSTYRNHVKTIANMSRDRGLYYMPSFRNINGSFDGHIATEVPWDPYTTWANQSGIIANLQEWIDFWVNVTKEFESEYNNEEYTYPNVIFDLHNEPHGNTTVRAVYIGTSKGDVGGAEECASEIRKYSERVTTFQWDYDDSLQSHATWMEYVQFNCSYNFMLQTHFYRKGSEALFEWNNTDANLATIGIVGKGLDFPVFIGEIGANRWLNDPDDQVGGLVQFTARWNETQWLVNLAQSIEDNDELSGMAIWWYTGAGSSYGIFRYPQWIGDMWHAISQWEFYIAETMAVWFDVPFVYSMDNKTVNGYLYPHYDDSSIYDSTWDDDNSELNVSYVIPQGELYEVRVFWNVTDYPLNSSVKILFDNNTLVNAMDYYNVNSSLVKIPVVGASPGSLLMGYNLAEQGGGWMGKIMGVTNPSKMLGVLVANINKVNRLD